jgi:hypothetical protein
MDAEKVKTRYLDEENEAGVRGVFLLVDGHLKLVRRIEWDHEELRLVSDENE